jgi:hypothetical protein
MCDLHGHSRKMGVFAYGCDKGPKDAAPAGPGWPAPGSLGGLPGAPPGVQARLFPLMLHLNAPDLFCYSSCSFKASLVAPALAAARSHSLERGVPNLWCLACGALPRTLQAHFLLRPQVQKSKAGTSRVVAFRELGLTNAFTLEASFCGPSRGRRAGQHFNAGDLEDMGAALVGRAPAAGGGPHANVLPACRFVL